MTQCRLAAKPSDPDFVKSLMQLVYEPGKMARSAPPEKGIKGLPVDYQDVEV
jgi:hypothetical protein